LLVFFTRAPPLTGKNGQSDRGRNSSIFTLDHVTGKREPQNIEQGTAEYRSAESLRSGSFMVIRTGRTPSFDIGHSLFDIGYSLFFKFHTSATSDRKKWSV